MDRARLRSLVGLTLGFSGPRAYLAVSGVLLTLLVSSRTSSALAITFALTAGRLFTWLTYPAVGAASDRAQSAVGRRVPFMAAGLFVMGCCTWGYTLAHGYWELVVIIIVVKQATAVFGLTTVPTLPETFGRKRTMKALMLTVILGTLVSLFIKGTVVATWKSNDPSTWTDAFRVAGIVMIAAALILVLLVREAPRTSVPAGERVRSGMRPIRDEISLVLSIPNNKVLLSSILIFWAGGGATGYLAIVYFQKVLHAGASAQTVAGLLTGVPGLLIGVPLGLLLTRIFTRRQIMIGAPLIGTVGFLVQYHATHMWQAVALGIVGAPLGTAWIMVSTIFLAQLLPRSGGLGERIGLFVAPFSACAVVVAFAGAVVVDATHNYRTIWLFPAVAGVLQAAVMTKIWIPEGFERLDIMPTLRRSLEGIEKSLETRRVPLLSGRLSADDIDSAGIVDSLRTFFPDPYARRDAGECPSDSDVGGGGISAEDTAEPASGGEREAGPGGTIEEA